MHDLRLIGVDADGQHLLLARADGDRYRLPIDDALRAAARADRPRLGQLQIEIDGGLRPREVQALLRRGLSAEEVSERAGWTVEKVRRFEGPVVAEREFMVSRARASLLGTRSGSTVTLASRVDSRLRERGLDGDDVTWDSAREDDGMWTVTASYAAGGRRRSALWRFDPSVATAMPSNDEARWLGEEETISLIPTPHVATSGTSDTGVFDIEAPGATVGPGEQWPGARAGGRHRDPTDEPIDLMAAMRQGARSRRGRRRTSPSRTPGMDAAPDDALPLEPLTRGLADLGLPPGARGERVEFEGRLGAGPGLDPEAGPALDPESGPEAEIVPESDPDPDPEPEPEVDVAVATAGESVTEDSPEMSSTPSPKRKGRARVPSWDDYVFGTKGPGTPGPGGGSPPTD